MNKGERDELLIKIKLLAMHKNNEPIPDVGIIKSLINPSSKDDHGLFHFDQNIEINNLNSTLNKIENYNAEELNNYANKIGLQKAIPGAKADIIINNLGVSLKSTRNAPPAIVNHTTRPGFEFAANNYSGDIYELDKIINEYWTLRLSNKIGQDIKAIDAPFINKKEKIKPFLNYFLFCGSGSKKSSHPAKIILSFESPLDTNSWKIYDESNYIDHYWNKLVFSIRSKGMPKGYPNVSSQMKEKKISIDIWTNYINDKYKGSLHIRAKR